MGKHGCKFCDREFYSRRLVEQHEKLQHRSEELKKQRLDEERELQRLNQERKHKRLEELKQKRLDKTLKQQRPDVELKQQHPDEERKQPRPDEKLKQQRTDEERKQQHLGEELKPPKRKYTKRQRAVAPQAPKSVLSLRSPLKKKDLEKINLTTSKRKLRQFHCKECDKYFFAKEIFKNHCERTHGKKICRLCQNTFDNVQVLRQHEKKEHGMYIVRKVCPPPRKNDIDERVERDKRVLEMLANHRHREPKETFWKIDDTVYTCPICARDYTHEASFRVHIWNHEDRHYLKCPTCGRKYITRWSLELHQEVHEMEKRGVCVVCERPYASIRYREDSYEGKCMRLIRMSE